MLAAWYCLHSLAHAAAAAINRYPVCQAYSSNVDPRWDRQTDRPPYRFIDPAPHNVRAVLISYTKQDAVMCVVFVIHFF